MEYEFVDVKFPKTQFETERTEGLHLSHIIRDLLDKAGLGYKGKGFTDMELTAEVGLLWERVLSKVMGEKYANSPGELEKDGIILTPDGIGPDPMGKVPIIVEEYKATWKSNRTHPTEVLNYMMQVKGYCYVVETNVCIMRVLYIMGDYRGSGPMYRESRITFTKKELWDNWQILLGHAEKEDMLDS